MKSMLTVFALLANCLTTSPGPVASRSLTGAAHGKIVLADGEMVLELPAAQILSVDGGQALPAYDPSAPVFETHSTRKSTPVAAPVAGPPWSAATRGGRS